MGYPPPPPPPGAPGGYPPPGGGQPPSGPYGAPPPGYPQPPPGGPPPGGYGGPPSGGYGGPPPGYAPRPPSGGGSGGANKGLIFLMAALVGVVLLIVVGALVLVLAGGEDDVELTQSQREQALLTDGDIGDGFSEADADDESGADAEGDEEPDAAPECLDLLDRLEEDGENPFTSDDDDADDSVTREFADDDSASVEHSIGIDEGIVALYEDLVDSCDEITFEDDTGTSTIGFSEGPAIDDVDGVFVVDIDFDFEFADGSGSVDYGGRIALWSVRGNASFVLITDGFSFDEEDFTAPPMAVAFDEGLFEDIVVTADEKLREVIDEA